MCGQCDYRLHLSSTPFRLNFVVKLITNEHVFTLWVTHCVHHCEWYTLTVTLPLSGLEVSHSIQLTVIPRCYRHVVSYIGFGQSTVESIFQRKTCFVEFRPGVYVLVWIYFYFLATSDEGANLDM